jgi:hypothetical protein
MLGKFTVEHLNDKTKEWGVLRTYPFDNQDYEKLRKVALDQKTAWLSTHFKGDQIRVVQSIDNKNGTRTLSIL